MSEFAEKQENKNRATNHPNANSASAPPTSSPATIATAQKNTPPRPPPSQPSHQTKSPSARPLPSPASPIAASSTKTIATITAGASQLVRIIRLRVTQDTHKTSEQYELYGQRASASGTGTAYTPVLKEPNAGAVNFTAKITHTVEPTYTAS